MKKVAVNFKETEIYQLIYYCREREKENWYYGNKEQFEKRHADIKKELEKARKFLELK